MIAINWDPTPRTLRQFAAAGAAVLVAMVIVVSMRGRGWWTIAPLLVLMTTLSVLAWVRPAVLRLPYVLLTLLAYPIGLVVSHLILLVLFFVVVTPLGLLARVARPHPLGSPWDRRVQTYWQRRARPRDPSSYMRQA